MTDPSYAQTAALIETARASGGPRKLLKITDYQEVINEAEMCLDSINRLMMMCPLGSLTDYAACPIVYDDPELIDRFLDELQRQGDPDKDL